MLNEIQIAQQFIGSDHPCYIIAELSANHNQNIETAYELIRKAKEAGANAVKLQTYLPETITIQSDQAFFEIKDTLWSGKKLYDLYQEAYTPWEWYPLLAEFAQGLGLDLFSSPFDTSAVDFLEQYQCPAYKIASFENVDLQLIQCVAKTKKPVIMSTGMATLGEIEEAVQCFYQAGGQELILLKCTSAYPTPPEECHLQTIPHLKSTFQVPVGLSDHTLGTTVPIVAVALGAKVIEKHFTLSRHIPGPDSAFSLEPEEFKQMVENVRIAERALGQVNYGGTPKEQASRPLRRSLFVVQDMAAGDIFDASNLRSIRPGHGLHTRYLGDILGKPARKAIRKGTPMSWGLIE